MVEDTTRSRPTRVRPAIRRLVYWLGPVLVLIASWQIWDAVEDARLERAVAAAFPEADGDPLRVRAPRPRLEDDAARYYAAASIAVQYPQDPWRNPAEAYREALGRGSDVPAASVPNAMSTLALNRIPLDLIAQARAMPYGAFRPGTEFNYRFGGLVALGQFAAVETLDLLRTGNLEGAARSVSVRLQLLRAIDDEPRLYSAATKSAQMQGIATDVGLLLGRGGAGQPVEDDLDRLIENAYAADYLVRVIEGEALFFYETLRSSWTYRAWPNPIARGFPMRPALKHYAAGMMQVTAGALAAARQPWPERIAAFNRIPDRRSLTPPMYRFFSAQALLETFRGLAPRQGSGVAAARAARLAIRIGRHRRETGGLPEGLDDLVPGIAVDVAMDPFTGGPLRYLREAGGFVVYSVGPDARDDGGTLTPELPPGRMPGTLPTPDIGVRVTYH